MLRKLSLVLVAIVALCAGGAVAIAASSSSTCSAPCRIVISEVRTNGSGGVTTDQQTISVPAKTTTVTNTVTSPPVTTTVTVTTPPPTTGTTATNLPPPPPSPSGVAPSGQGSMAAGLPVADATCANRVTPTPENRPDNTTPNSTMPANNGASVPWGTGDDSFTLWPKERGYVTGHYTGTTDEILQWGTCKWGLPADLARAEAISESDWHQLDVGDKCGTDGTTGTGSYGILQLKNLNCSGVKIDGGWPDTQNDTALATDFWGAHIRACFDGAFSGWLYDGVSVQQDASNHENYADPLPLAGDPGWDYILWGCVGQWYSGGWWNSDAVSYINGVQGHYTAKPWLQSGF